MIRNSNGNRSIVLDGEHCISARRRLGLTREALSAQTRGAHPISESTIKRAERGEALYLSTASRLAEVLGVALEELVSDRARSDLLTSTSAAERRLAGIAVVPFRTHDAGSQYFAVGIADDLVARLSRWWFPVFARGSIHPLDPGSTTRMLAELDADYLVEGQVLRTQGRVRVSVRLLRVMNEQVLWAEVYDRTLEEVFATQDELATAIVASVGVRVLESEVQDFAQDDPTNLGAWEQALLGAWHFYHRQPDRNRKARTLLQDAVKAEPHSPLAWYTLAMTHQQDLLHQWTDNPREALQQLAAISSTFQQVYPHDSRSHVAAAYAQVYMGNREAAMSRLTEAIALDPNMGAAYSLYGQTLAMGNEPERALEQFEVALRLSSRDSERWAVLLSIALSHFVAERYSDAIASAHQAIPVSPNVAFSYGVLASAHAHLGNIAEAEAALATMLRLASSFSGGGFSTIMSSTHPDIAARYMAGLRRAGLRA